VNGGRIAAKNVLNASCKHRPVKFIPVQTAGGASDLTPPIGIVLKG
jgi:hypothetical protein